MRSQASEGLGFSPFVRYLCLSERVVSLQQAQNKNQAKVETPFIKGTLPTSVEYDWFPISTQYLFFPVVFLAHDLQAPNSWFPSRDVRGRGRMGVAEGMPHRKEIKPDICPGFPRPRTNYSISCRVPPPFVRLLIGLFQCCWFVDYTRVRCHKRCRVAPFPGQQRKKCDDYRSMPSGAISFDGTEGAADNDAAALTIKGLTSFTGNGATNSSGGTTNCVTSQS